MTRKIVGWRKNFATNSSSLHSVAFLLFPHDVQERVPRSDFGRDEFVLLSVEEKLCYLWACGGGERRDFPTDELYERAQKIADDRDVDHQSKGFLETSQWTTADWNLFFSPSVAVLGGDDNERPYHALYQAAHSPKALPLFGRDEGQIKRRFDPRTGIWTFFSSATGLKVHVRDESVTPTSLRAFSPELVDLKITDACPYQCAFCYQGSTPLAPHASWEDVEKVLEVCVSAGVLEVALGGGEPTLAPFFSDIGKWAEKNAGRLHLSVTTRNLVWVEKYLSSWCKYYSPPYAVAYSADTLREVTAFLEVYYKCFLCPRYEDEHEDEGEGEEWVKPLVSSYERTPYCCVQIIVGGQPEEEWKAMVELLQKRKFPFTLLGWKTTGRGKSVSPYTFDWLAFFRQKGIREVSIDTALARQTPQLREVADPRTFFTEEGKVSCAIDAVGGLRIASSSYSLRWLPLDLTKFQEAWDDLAIEGEGLSTPASLLEESLFSFS